jgi:Mrp family chromosome partitioning ATPase
MSKLYEALQQEPGRTQARMTRGPATPRLITGSRQSMEALHQALEGALPGFATRVVQFVASRKGEGTTTIVHEFAMTLHLVFKKSILIVDANPNHGAVRAFGARDVAPLSELLRAVRGAADEKQHSPGVTLVTYDGEVLDLPAAQTEWGVNFGDILRGHFDYVLFDVAALGTTARAISFARHVDGVVIIVEAEKTRWPVVENTKKAYEAVGETIIGVILNKRAFYIPKWLYKRL